MMFTTLLLLQGGGLLGEYELAIMLVKIRRNWSVNMTILLVSLVAKMDLVSKNVSKREKWSIIGGVL